MFRKPGFALLSVAVYAISFATLAVASWLTGPTFAEMERIAAITDAERLVVNLVEHGPSVLVSSSAMAIYEGAKHHGTWATIAGAWFSLAAKHAGGVDVLTAGRAPWLAVTACLPLATFWMAERAFGTALAVLAAALLLVQPALLHGAAVGSDAAIVAALELLVFACYLRGLRGRGESFTRRRIAWALATAAALGLAVATHLGSAWVVPAVFAHFALLNRRALRRAISRGRFPMPAAALLGLVITPLAFLGCAPHAWRGGASKLLSWVLAPLGTSGTGFLYRGDTVREPPFPASEPLHWLVATTPLAIVVLAFLGFGYWVRRVLEGERGRDTSGLGIAAALFVVATIVAPWALPPLLASFPVRTVAASVFLTLMAALGLDGIARQVLPPRRASMVIPVAALGFAVLWIDLPSAGGGYTRVVGGPSGVLANRTFPPSDGSEAARVVPLAKAMGAASVTSKDVPERYWATLVSVERAPASFGRKGKGEVELVRGAAPDAAAVITYHGGVLWSLVR